MKKFLIIFIGFLFVTIVIDTIYIKTSHKLEVKEYEPIEIVYSFSKDFTKEEVRKSIVELFDTPHLYLELNISGDGLTSIPLRVVIVNPDVNTKMYSYVLAHELTHLKYRTQDETWVSFMAFKTLYDSGNEILKNSALYYADKVMSGWYDGAYNIGYYILEYLEAQDAL